MPFHKRRRSGFGTRIDTGGGLRGAGDGVSGDLEHPRTGMGFSMRVGGRDPIQWQRRLAMTDSTITSSTTYMSLASGRNLVSWAGYPRSLSCARR